MSRRRYSLVGQILLLGGILLSVLSLSGVGGADTAPDQGPDTNTKADWSPNQVDATHGQGPATTFTGAFEGRTLSIHVDSNGNPGHFFGVRAARLCRSGLKIITQSQMNPTQFGNCIEAPFQQGKDDDDVIASAAPSNDSVDFGFRVGEGTEATHSGPGSPITCDDTHPCAVWLDESVDPAYTSDSSGDAFKHYDIQYAAASTTTTTAGGAGTTTTTTGPGTTTTTTGGGTTTTTVGAGTTTTTAGSGTTTTTIHATTTTTSGTGTTTTTTGSGTTTSTTAAPTTTTTSHSATTTTTAPVTTTTSHSATTTTTRPTAATTTTVATGTTTTTAPSFITTPTVGQGGTLSVDSPGWKAGSQVTGVANSTPVTLGTLNADSTGTVTGSFTLPLSIQPGSHTLVLSGTGTDGLSRSMSSPFTVTSVTGGSAGNTTSASLQPSTDVAGSSLARTGFRSQLLWIGMMLSAIGAVMVMSSRRRAQQQS
jgi:hypothetical protein